MIKIKLTESRTLPVPDSLVEHITRVYRSAFIKLVVDYINRELDNPELQQKLVNRYNILLNKIQKTYSQEYSDSQKFDFVRDINLDSTIADGELIESIPVKQFIMALPSWSGLETYLRGRMDDVEFVERLKEYFLNKNVEDIQFVIEFGSRGTTSKKDYAGLYQSDIDSIIITFNASFFVDTPTEYKNRYGEQIVSPSGLSVAVLSPDKIIENIQTELEETRTSVRHELQHLFQNMFSQVLGAGDEQSWLVGLPPKRVLQKTKADDSEHHKAPIEMSTDIQDEVDKFQYLLNKFKESNKANLNNFAQSAKILAKLFADSALSPQEKKFADTNKLNKYIISSDLFRKIKISGDQELYNYALNILYNSIRDQIEQTDKLSIPLSQRYERDIRENIVMNKIKVVLSERKNLISEDMSKDEIRKIIRDEFEKLLKDKDSKKEIAKITKEFMKKFYRELSFSSTHVIDQVDV